MTQSRTALRRSLIAALLLMAGCWLMAGPAAAAVDEGDKQRIRGIIESQIQAFLVDDGDRAFSFASPRIRQKFGSVENFMAMVKGGYRAVYRPREIEFLDLKEERGLIRQAVRLVGPDGETVIAVYTMERQSDGGWKIGGVYLVRTADENA